MNREDQSIMAGDIRCDRDTRLRRRSMMATILTGIGLMAAIDEIVFHQLLAWHHFYDQSTPAIALLSDGLLPSAELIFLIGGFFMFADLRRRHALARISAWAGFFIGLRTFQLFDGIIDHKVQPRLSMMITLPGRSAGTSTWRT